MFRNSRNNLSLRLAGTLVAGALALVACGGDDVAGDTPVTSDDQGIAVGEPNGPGADDPNAGGAGDTMPAGHQFSPEERADMLFGQTEEEANNLALEFGWSIRTGRVDDEQYMVTEDYVIDRMTLEYDTPEDGGEPVVTVVVIELEDGPRTFTAQ